jgi:dephospho-CoA kinase
MNSKCPRIIVLIGHTGAGKTEIARRICDSLFADLLTFSQMGKELASANGYVKIRDYFEATPTHIFQSEFNSYLTSKILEKTSESGRLLVEGLIAIDTINSVKRKIGSVLVCYLYVPHETRIDRLCHRLSCTRENAIQEEATKNTIKAALGIEDAIGQADITVDGCQAIDKVAVEVLKRISESTITFTIK